MLAVAYVFAGVGVYATTAGKVSELERSIQTHMPVNIPFRASLLAAIVALWPLWLLAAPRIKESRGPF